MSRNIITALDVGTSTVQTIVAEQVNGEHGLRILGIGVVPSAGMRRGIVVDLDDVSSSIRQSIAAAERASGMPIKSAWISVGGAHISVATSKGVIAVSRADGEISPEDVRRATAAAETFVSRNPNKEVLHIIPRDFKVDNEGGIKDPVGMHGVRLEVDTLIIECSSSFLKNLVKAVEGAGIAVEDYVFAPLAASYAVLTKRQRELGVMLVDIGGGVASFMVYEEGVPIHAGVIPVGGNLITNDVAIGFRTHVDVAERIKLSYGSCIPAEMSKRDSVRLAEFIAEDTSVYPRKELAEIIQARLLDILEVLQKELKKIDRKQLLPAGVVLVGGSALLPGVLELTRSEMGLSAELGKPDIMEIPDPSLAPTLATAYGILKWVESHAEEPGAAGWKSGLSQFAKAPWMKWFKSFLP